MAEAGNRCGYLNNSTWDKYINQAETLYVDESSPAYDSMLELIEQYNMELEGKIETTYH